jgi:hypothetical protein
MIIEDVIVMINHKLFEGIHPPNHRTIEITQLLYTGAICGSNFGRFQISIVTRETYLKTCHEVPQV